MTNVFALRRFDPPLRDEQFAELSQQAASYLALYRVQERESLLSADGRRMFCWFEAPDAESTRQALRQAGSDDGVPWPGTVHDAPGEDAPRPDEANVAVERSFPEAVTLEEIQALEDAGAWCLETHRVQFVRTFFSVDRQRMVCLYRAPDAEAVRQAQRMARMPVDAVWSFRRWA